jgi:hypothetical protein
VLIGRKSILGLVSLTIPGSLLSIGMMLSFAYASHFIYALGDIGQFEPLFLGIVVGSVLSSLVGYLAKSTWLVLSFETLVASLLLVSSYTFMMVDSLLLSGTLIFIVSLSMTSVQAPVATTMRLYRHDHSAPARAVFGVTQAVFAVLLVYVFSFYYVTNGQLDFFIGPVTMLTLSLVSFLILLRVR